MSESAKKGDKGELFLLVHVAIIVLAIVVAVQVWL